MLTPIHQQKIIVNCIIYIAKVVKVKQYKLFIYIKQCGKIITYINLTLLLKICVITYNRYIFLNLYIKNIL